MTKDFPELRKDEQQLYKGAYGVPDKINKENLTPRGVKFQNTKFKEKNFDVYKDDPQN